MPPADESVRPTTDRIKETIFNILQWDVEGARVLDLFCGSGALGIECISRGAAEVVFVDKSRDSVDLTKRNLQGIEGNYRVVNADFLGVLRSGDTRFDIIFVDAPYMSGLGEVAVDAVFDCDRLAEGGVVVYEHSTELPYVPQRNDVVARTKRMGTVTVDFVRAKRVALVTGSFDPVTKGHEEVIKAALADFDEVVVACLVNPEKNYMFTPEERLRLVKAALADEPRAKAIFSEGTAVDVAKSVGASVIVRGVRGEGDLDYENAMAEYNRESARTAQKRRLPFSACLCYNRSTRDYEKQNTLRGTAEARCTMETIDMLINEIESEVLKAKKATFSPTDIVLNRQVMLDLITRFRASYPIVLKEAEQIKKERDDILAKAEAYANKTMDAAEQNARALMSETEVLKKATAEAQAMRAEAEENYRKMDYEARSLAFNILDSAEKSIKEGLNVINDRKRKLIED